MRNLEMAERIGATPVRNPFTFVVAGDTGAWPDPTADAIFAQLLRQVAELDPAPVFFAAMGQIGELGERRPTTWRVPVSMRCGTWKPLSRRPRSRIA